MGAQWYVFTTVGGADPLNPSFFILFGPVRPSCPGYHKICAILAYDDGFGYPVITQIILEDMVRALQFGTDQTTVVLRF